MKTTGNDNPVLEVVEGEGNHVKLENGIWLRCVGDGTARNDDDGSEWQMVSEIINPETEEYRFLGWQLR